MSKFKEKIALLSVQSKVIIAFLCGCAVIVFAWLLSQVVFKKTFSAVEVISRPNPKLILINSLFQKIQRLDYLQKTQVLNLANKPYNKMSNQSESIILLLDSLLTYCADDSLQSERIKHMQKIVYERDALYLSYLKFQYGILKDNPLSKNINELSDYIAKNIKKNDSTLVKTTKKNITKTTILNIEKVKAEKKEPFFKRVFGKKKTKEEQEQSPQKLVTEEIEQTTDTFAVTQRDSFMKDIERSITSLEKNRYDRHHKLQYQELRLITASTSFIDELEKLLRQVENEEIYELQQTTDSLSSVFDDAFTWIEIILCAFLVIILILIFLIFSDISHSHRIRLQLIEAKEKAEHLEKVKHRFLANMSHELRTPLQSILGYSEQIKHLDTAPKQSLEAIHQSSEHLLQIVNEVLDYSRIVSGKFTFSKQDFNLEDTIAEVAGIMEGQAEKKDIGFRLKTEIPESVLYSGDPFRLKQILFNLLGNAIKFTDKGEVSLSIKSKALPKNKTEFSFEIRDTGIGMSADDLKKIFSSFEQAGEGIQSRYGGTGLGLSIAKQLTEMQGGSLKVESEKNKGTCFYLKLSYPAAHDQKVSISEVSPVLNNFKGGKILVVDDDLPILQLCSLILSKNNIPHLSYSFSEKVLQDNWDEEIKMVLMDIRMPVIGGIELFRILKGKVSADVRFVALTAQALPEEKEFIKQQGFDAVLLKPFREKEFLEVLLEHSEPILPATGKDTFDVSSVKIMSAGDEALFKTTLNLFLKEIKTDLQSFEEAVTKKDFALLANSTHKLSSKTGQLGMLGLASSFRLTESEARTKNAEAFQQAEYQKEKTNELIKSLQLVING